MCGRYLLDVDFNELYQKFAIFEAQQREIDHGDVYPTNSAPVILFQDNRYVLKFMTWGLPAFQKHQRLINARSETLLQKPRFSRLMNGQRCAVPAAAFYEWEKQGRQKFRHTFKSSGIIMFAGLYESTPEGEAFTIITMPATGDVVRIHDRMPVALDDDALKVWLNQGVQPAEAYERLMNQVPVYIRNDDEEQLSIF